MEKEEKGKEARENRVFFARTRSLSPFRFFAREGIFILFTS